MSTIRLGLSLLLTLTLAGTLCAGSPFIEVQVGEKQFRGRVAAEGKKNIWLLTQDGRMKMVRIAEVTKFHQLSPQFRSWPPSVLREKLLAEFGKSFHVVTSRHYVVCAVGEKKAKEYADMFEAFFHSFYMYFSARGFKMEEPEFPLVAIIFPDKEAYGRYAVAEGVSLTWAIAYYQTTTNRIALYEEPTRAARQSRLDLPRGFLPLAGLADSRDSLCVRRSTFFNDDAACGPVQAGHVWGTVPGDLKNTMIHEATHQAASNTGLHSRMAGDPKWVIEGLATVFEAPGIRNSPENSGLKSRLNHDRFIGFGNYVKERRQPGSLESFLTGDELFDTNIYDAYGQAWALSFFLIETRPRLYAEYLRTMAARNHIYVYSPKSRLADFKKTVSKELPVLEAEFLRFMAGIK